jgi:CBS domain-containing protein
MKVHSIMTAPAYTCKLDTPLTVASQRMDQTGYGMLIVLDKRGKPAGILTDRDLALAIGRSDGNPSHLRADQAMTSHVHTCSPDDSVHAALELMRDARVRRLPVITANGDLRGLLSIDDIVLWAVDNGGVTKGDLTRALRAICAAHAPLDKEPVFEASLDE